MEESSIIFHNPTECSCDEESDEENAFEKESSSLLHDTPHSFSYNYFSKFCNSKKVSLCEATKIMLKEYSVMFFICFLAIVCIIVVIIILPSIPPDTKHITIDEND